MSSDQEHPVMREQLDPRYKAAERDCVIVIRFSGNTAQPAGLDLYGVDPFQMLAMAEFLRKKAHHMLEAGERQLQNERIQTTNDMPPSNVKPGDGIVLS